MGARGSDPAEGVRGVLTAGVVFVMKILRGCGVLHPFPQTLFQQEALLQLYLKTASYRIGANAKILVSMRTKRSGERTDTWSDLSPQSKTPDGVSGYARLSVESVSSVRYRLVGFNASRRRGSDLCAYSSTAFRLPSASQILKSVCRCSSGSSGRMTGI